MEYTKKNTEDPKLLLSVKEACKLTGVSEKTMRSLAYEQKNDGANRKKNFNSQKN